MINKIPKQPQLEMCKTILVNFVNPNSGTGTYADFNQINDTINGEVELKFDIFYHDNDGTNSYQPAEYHEYLTKTLWVGAPSTPYTLAYPVTH